MTSLIELSREAFNRSQEADSPPPRSLVEIQNDLENFRKEHKIELIDSNKSIPITSEEALNAVSINLHRATHDFLNKANIISASAQITQRKATRQLSLHNIGEINYKLASQSTIVEGLRELVQGYAQLLTFSDFNPSQNLLDKSLLNSYAKLISQLPTQQASLDQLRQLVEQNADAVSSLDKIFQGVNEALVRIKQFNLNEELGLEFNATFIDYYSLSRYIEEFLAPLPIGYEQLSISWSKGSLVNILGNLAQNFQRYGHPEHGDIKVNLSKQTFEGKEYVVLRVEDNGVGFPRELLRSDKNDTRNVFKNKSAGGGAKGSTQVGMEGVFDSLSKNGGRYINGTKVNYSGQEKIYMTQEGYPSDQDLAYNVGSIQELWFPLATN